MRRKKWMAVGLTLGALAAVMALSFAALGASGLGEELGSMRPYKTTCRLVQERTVPQLRNREK